MIENHAAMKWERLANEYLKERDECLDLATKNRVTADRYRASLERIRDNADSMLLAQNAIGTPDDAPERINALWLHTETTAALEG